MKTNGEEATWREAMVSVQIAARGVRDSRVLAAMRRVPRHLFVPGIRPARAYDDEPLPIGESQTISQPYIVAYMTETLGLQGGERVLEVGTGSGYQTAVLAEVAGEVFTVELLPGLAEKARRILDGLGYTNVSYRVGDGSAGWPEEAPFDAIMVTAAPAVLPPALREQLRINGRMIIPVGLEFQDLVLVTRLPRGYDERRLISVRFVPLINTIRGGR